MNSQKIRDAFIAYFVKHLHVAVPSASLIPGNDPTLLFTNAGMVPFKDVFTGREHRAETRLTSVQRCVRAGGKHNDLDQVGYTARHHTFFEMLGNFSFGDYFKREAIQMAWTFLTEVFQIPATRLWVTVYQEDDEAADIWLNEMKVSPERFSRCGKEDNFWMMGETGPCGPCSEIYYDHGPDIPGGPPGSPDQDLDRYVEIWNLVFMQYNRNREGQLTPLPKPSVDTGMGFERLVAVLQGVHSNYDTDLFQPIIQFCAQLANLSKKSQNEKTKHSLQVIADHIRSCAFLMMDGVVPSNEGRGYVLRRIIRRAIRHGHQLGFTEIFFYQLLTPLIQVMGQAYPDLIAAKARIEASLQREEDQFVRTLSQGMRIFSQEITKFSGKKIPGELAFRLYDTFGFPVDLTQDMAREQGLTVDLDGFNEHLEKVRHLSQGMSQFQSQEEARIAISGASHFTGYHHLENESKIIGIVIAGKTAQELKAGQKGSIILDQTPFYAEGGGQVGDCGRLNFAHGFFLVEDTKKQDAHHVHVGVLQEGMLRIGDTVSATVQRESRLRTARNHSATHLLHAALREILGEHVLQKGSLVSSEKLRFDFSHFQALTPEELRAVEHRVNTEICANHPAQTCKVKLDEAKNMGAMALFGEKYQTDVRVLRMGEFSLEICGGTHVKATGDIGLFKIINESGIASGVRRIEALTGDLALEWLQIRQNKFEKICQLLQTDVDQIQDKVLQLLEKNKTQEKEISQLKTKMTVQSGQSLPDKVVKIGDVSVLALECPQIDRQVLRQTLDQLKQKMLISVIVLASIEDNKVNLVGGVSKTLCEKMPAGELIADVAKLLEGKGGGRADMAQGGGTAVNKLPEALRFVYKWVEERMSGE